MEARYYDFSKQTVRCGTDKSPRHSEASVIEKKDGSLLMAWQHHQKDETAQCGDMLPSHIALADSFDGGKTWVKERIVAGMKGDCVNVYAPSFLRNSDGSISLFFMRYMQLEKGKPVLNNYYRITSWDEGETWTGEETLWELGEFVAMNHCIKRLADGSALMPVYGGVSGLFAKDSNYKVMVYRSTDDFKTWTASNMLSLPMYGCMEPCIAQRSDGVLNMVMRTQLGSVFFSESFDSGSTWTKPQTTGLRAPESCPCIVSIPQSDAQLVIWNNSEYDHNYRSHYGKRTPLTMAISLDGLKTFSDYFDIETDPDYAFTNPSVTVTSDGLFVLNYWTAPYNEKGIFELPLDLKIATFRIHKEGLTQENERIRFSPAR